MKPLRRLRNMVFSPSRLTPVCRCNLPILRSSTSRRRSCSKPALNLASHPLAAHACRLRARIGSTGLAMLAPIPVGCSPNPGSMAKKTSSSATDAGVLPFEGAKATQKTLCRTFSVGFSLLECGRLFIIQVAARTRSMRASCSLISPASRASPSLRCRAYCVRCCDRSAPLLDVQAGSVLCRNS